VRLFILTFPPGSDKLISNANSGGESGSTAAARLVLSGGRINFQTLPDLVTESLARIFIPVTSSLGEFLTVMSKIAGRKRLSARRGDLQFRHRGFIAEVAAIGKGFQISDNSIE